MSYPLLNFGRLYHFVILIIITILISGCFGSKKTEEPKTDWRFTTIEMIEAVDQWKLNYNWFSAELDLDLESTQFSGGAKGQILIHKDSATLLTVRKFGVEIFRALITPDSLMAIERMSRKYYKGPIRNEVLPDIGTFNYKTIESLLSAQYPFLEIEDQKIEMDQSEYKLTIDDNKGETKAVYALLRDENLSPATLVLSENTQNKAQFIFNSPQHIDGKWVNMGRDIIIEGGWDWPFTLSAKYKNIELDVPGNISFSIPPSYERMD